VIIGRNPPRRRAILFTMIFGDPFRPADATTSTRWIDEACQGEWWTVGALVPNHYEGLLRVYAPAPCDAWWSAYREIFEVVASVGERHTSSPDEAWFAVWEGHGFDNITSRVVWWDAPADEAEQQARDDERHRLRDEDRRRNAAIRTELNRIPRSDRPGRAYYLLTGPVRAVTELHHPDAPEWRNPDLFWPDDRRWFVATDVDFWSLYIGGSSSFVREIAESIPTPCVHVKLDVPLEIED
jgi:hypothetical protein